MPTLSCASAVRGAEVRREDEIRQPAQRGIRGQRLHLEDVERRGGDLLALQRLDQRRFIDQAAARAVDDAHALLRLREALGVEHVLRLRA